jgi:hypothetical protein
VHPELAREIVGVGAPPFGRGRSWRPFRAGRGGQGGERVDFQPALAVRFRELQRLSTEAHRILNPPRQEIALAE